LVISSYSISKSPLAAGDSFTLTITAKNNMGLKAEEISLSGVAEYKFENVWGESDQVSHGIFDRITRAVSWGNNTTKTFTFNLKVHDNMWEILQELKAEADSKLAEGAAPVNIRSSSIKWILTAHSAGTEDNFAGETDSASFTTGVLLDWRYAPKVDVFALERIMDGVPNDEGVNLMADMKLSADERAQTELFTLKLHYAEGASASTSSPYIDLTAHIPDLLSGVTDSTTLISETFANNLNWNFLLVFGDTYESVQARTTVPRAFANLHLSGASTGGAAFGGFSTSTEDNPLLECHYPAKMYGSLEVSGAAALNGGISNFGNSVQSGVVTVSSVSDESVKDATIKFSKAFKSKPFVMICGYTSSTAPSYGRLLFTVVADSVTTSQFKVRVHNYSGGTKNPDIMWLAIGTM